MHTLKMCCIDIKYDVKWVFNKKLVSFWILRLRIKKKIQLKSRQTNKYKKGKIIFLIV